MSTSRSPRRGRIRRILLGILLFVLFVSAVRFCGWRGSDLRAWPEPAAGEAPAAVPPAETNALATPADCRALLAVLPPADAAPAAALERFAREGATALSDAERAALRARAGTSNEVLRAYVGFLESHPGFVPAAGADVADYAMLLARSGELDVLFALAAASGEDGLCAADLGRQAGRVARAFGRGCGITGRFAALQGNVSFLSRECILLSLEAPGAFSGAPETIGAFRAAEDAFAPLPDAIREDWAAYRVAVADVYDQVEGRAPRDGSASVPGQARVSGTMAFLIRNLGGGREATLAHLDALFSRLAANAASPYSPEGMAQGLPEWCRDPDAHTPWTRDPVGAVLGSSYVRQALAAGAFEPSARLELRAARLAVALRTWRDAHGEYPATLDELLGGVDAPLREEDVADPFSPAGERLRYARDGAGWRFHSVGLDQRDDGGASGAADPRASGTDFLFTSREREFRKASSHGKKP